MIKNSLLALFLFLPISLLFSQEKEVGVEVKDTLKIQLNWMPFYKDALQKAKKEKKPVLIYFKGSDWCGPCKAIDKQLLSTQKFKDFSDKTLVLLEVDIPRNQDLVAPDKLSENLYLKEKYKVNSFPTLLFVNHRGRKISEKKGYVLTEYYYPYIQSVVYNY